MAKINYKKGLLALAFYTDFAHRGRRCGEFQTLVSQPTAVMEMVVIFPSRKHITK
jgi:hypothetical protein